MSLKWDGHVIRRDEERVGIEGDGDGCEGRWRNGRLKLRWMDSTNKSEETRLMKRNIAMHGGDWSVTPTSH